MKLRFKTNVKCMGCKQAVGAYLNAEPSITGWKVDIYDPERLLTVEGERPDAAKIISLLHQAGYQAILIENKTEQ